MIGPTALYDHLGVTVQVSPSTVVRSAQLRVVCGCVFGGYVNVGKLIEIGIATAGAAAKNVMAVNAVRVMRVIAFSFVKLIIKVNYMV